jgi:4-hydroxy-2-oxoheptanedioate aldolase
VQRANTETWLAAQIESPTALDEVDAIADVPGVDVVFFGPGDFSCLIGKPGQFMHTQVLDAAERVAEAAHRAGKVFGTIGVGEEHTRAMVQLGAGLLNLGADQGLLKKAMADLLGNRRRG